MTVPDFTRTQLRAGAPGHDTAITIGVLDGVHRGHQHLLETLVREAHARGLSPGVVTLHPHPLTVLRPDTRPSYLTSLEERIQRIVATGCDWVTPLTFTSEVAEVECEELGQAFVTEARMKLLVLGPDSAFGRGAPRDTPDRMRRLGSEAGFEVLQIEPLVYDGVRYSSTAVRQALAVGDMARVTTLLGRHYHLAGPVVRAMERGRTIGFPTANISVAVDRALPALGVYATRVHLGERTFMGATNIGQRPTFEAGHVSIETYILDFEGDIYGQRLELEVVARIREEIAFPNVGALVEQIGRDVETARRILE